MKQKQAVLAKNKGGMKDEKRAPLIPRKRPGSKRPDAWIPEEEPQVQEQPAPELDWQEGEMYRIYPPAVDPNRVLN